MGDSDGYGYTRGNGDTGKHDAEVWFDVEDTGDTDGDGLTYWEEATWTVNYTDY